MKHATVRHYRLIPRNNFISMFHYINFLDDGVRLLSQKHRKHFLVHVLLKVYQYVLRYNICVKLIFQYKMLVDNRVSTRVAGILLLNYTAYNVKYITMTISDLLFRCIYSELRTDFTNEEQE